MIKTGRKFPIIEGGGSVNPEKPSFILCLKFIPVFLLAITLPFSVAMAQIDADFSGGGGVKIGTSSTTCDAAAEGAMRYNTTSNKMEYCDGTSWLGLANITIAASLVISPSSFANMDTSGTGYPAYGSYVTFTVQNIGNSTSQTITTQLSNMINFELGTDNCNGNSLAASATCTIQVRPKSYVDTTYTGYLNILADNQPSASMSGTSTGSCGAAGDSVGGGELVSCNSGYALVVTPGGCTDSTTPTCAGGSDSTTKQWSDVTVTTGATSLSDGVSNTSILLAASDNYYAAEYCGNMTYGGYSDWYLPAIDELAQIYPVKSSLSGLTNGDYWSSTETSAYNARSLSMNTGGVNNYRYKLEPIFVRCTRRN